MLDQVAVLALLVTCALHCTGLMRCLFRGSRRIFERAPLERKLTRFNHGEGGQRKTCWGAVLLPRHVISHRIRVGKLDGLVGFKAFKACTPQEKQSQLHALSTSIHRIDREHVDRIFAARAICTMQGRTVGWNVGTLEGRRERRRLRNALAPGEGARVFSFSRVREGAECDEFRCRNGRRR